MSNPNSNYPSCSHGVYSLRRLYAFGGPPSNQKIHVGGRVHCNGTVSPLLTDAGGHLELPHDFCLKTGAKHLETWVISFYHCDFQNQNGSGQLLEFTEAVRMTAPLRELNWALPQPPQVLAWGPFVDRIKVFLKNRG